MPSDTGTRYTDHRRYQSRFLGAVIQLQPERINHEQNRADTAPGGVDIDIDKALIKYALAVEVEVVEVKGLSKALIYKPLVEVE
jgi:hypothetical protein